MIQPSLINLNANEYGQELHYYPFAVNLDMCVGSCNTLDGLSSKVCVPNETEDLNLYFFSMAPGISESRTLAKHISCKCDSRFDGRRFSSNHNCWCECKKDCF